MQIVVILCDTPRHKGRGFTGRTGKKQVEIKVFFQIHLEI